jgi:hypothetical protein
LFVFDAHPNGAREGKIRGDWRVPRLTGLVVRLSVALWVVALAACAAMPGAASPEDAVKARAGERWVFLLKGDLNGAYEYMSPGSKALMSLERYKKSVVMGIWTGAKVQSATCQADICKVIVAVAYQVKARGVRKAVASERALTETWRRESGQWWYVSEVID